MHLIHVNSCTRTFSASFLSLHDETTVLYMYTSPILHSNAATPYTSIRIYITLLITIIVTCKDKYGLPGGQNHKTLKSTISQVFSVDVMEVEIEVVFS